MGKYVDFSASLNRAFRNLLNTFKNDVDNRIAEQKTRVDDLITGTPQPSEVIDARGGEATLSARLNKVDTTLAEKSNVSNQKIIMNNEGSIDIESLVDLANFGGADVVRRGFVIHHYNDGEMCVLDNVGENNVFLLLRNANNPVRRPDKAADWTGTGDFLRAQDRYNNAGTWQAVTVFELLKNGDLKWGNRGATVNDGVRLINAQPSANGKFAFTLKNVTQNNNVLDIQAAEGKSVLYIQNSAGTRADITSPTTNTSGMKISAGAGNLELNANATGLIQLTSPAFSKTSTGWAEIARHVPKPSSATAAGAKGDYHCDGTHLYICWAPNTWVRTSVATW
jgi:hypothetical protein